MVKSVFYTLCAVVALAGLLVAPASAYADEAQTVPLLFIVVGFDGGDDASSAVVESGGGDAFDEVPEEVQGDAAAVVEKPDPLVVSYDSGLDWGSAIFGQDGSLASYYLDMSGGDFTFAPAVESSAYGADGNYNEADRENDGVVHVVLHRPHGSWGLVNEKTEVAQEFGRVALEAFQAAAPYVDFASFDANGDGLLSPRELAVGICIAGYDASPYDNPGRTDIPVMWPHAGKLASGDSEAAPADGMRLDSYIAIAEYLSFDADVPMSVQSEPLGILYHELGHYLDLPDLYALNDDAQEAAWGAYRVGQLSLMDDGGWAQVPDEASPWGVRYAPVAFDAWSRYVLGWTTPQVATESGDYVLRAQDSAQGYSQLLVPTGEPDQFYLLENRQMQGYDAGLATFYPEAMAQGGVVVWLVDMRPYRSFALDNQVNNSDHAPAVMQLFLEKEGDAYSCDWQRTSPDVAQPFYDVGVCAQAFANTGGAVPLPVHGSVEEGPDARTDSGVTMSVLTESAPEMTVHVEFTSQVAATAARAYPLDDQAVRDLRVGQAPLGALAAGALVVETQADVGLVDAGCVADGIPQGNVSWAQAYGVLSASGNIACYNLSGAQLRLLAEDSLAQAAPYRKLSGALDAIGSLSFLAGEQGVEDVLEAVSRKAASSANDVLTFAGMSFDVDWDASDGVRASNFTIQGQDLLEDEQYYVTMTPSVARAYDVFATLPANTLLLWGSPADAVRSYLQQPDWEDGLA